MTCRLISLNCRGLANKEKRNEMMHWLSHHTKGPFDIILLQETHFCQKDEKLWNIHAKTHFTSYKTIFSHGTRASRGVIIIIKENYFKLIQNIDSVKSGRYIFIDLDINETALTLLNAYAPNLEDQNNQTEFWDHIYQKLSIKEDRQIIIGGDLNVILNGEMDRKPPMNKTYKGVTKLKNVMDALSLSDFWRLANENIKRFTWRRHKPQLIQSRLDYWIASKNLYHRLMNIDILPGFRTDHSAITMTINVISDEERRGPGLWKFNSNLLTNQEYTDKVIELIQTLTREHSTMNAHQKWEFIKYKIRAFSIKFSKGQAHMRRKKQKELYNKLTTIEQQLDKENDSKEAEQLVSNLNMTRKELEHLEKIEAYG